MLKYILLLSCVFFFTPNDETIEWNDSLELNWNYFRGQPDFDNSAVAITASGLTFGYSVKKTNERITGFQANVKAYFYPDKSWYKQEQVNDTILMHERLHFDITEWHARLLRKEISSLAPSQTIESILDKLYAQMSKALRDIQSQYDLETDHSRDLEQQVLWQQRVAKELNMLEKFKD